MNDTVIRLLVNEEEPVYRTHKDRVFTDPDSHPAFYRVLQRNRPKGRSV